MQLGITILEEAYPDVPIHTVQVSASVSHSEHKLPHSKKKNLNELILYNFDESLKWTLKN